ncbi:MAG: hypothetical protein Q7R52_02385, partial [archaeon]|nr:hypothetical protein [archaeon]
MVDNAALIKERIINILNRRGPSLPVHVAKEVNLSMLFASAFLSELFAERKIKISNMKVGGSPLYFLPQHESMLENFFQFLKNKEKEAFLLLKENKILKDSELDPAIRVALREIKDFAIPSRKNEELWWIYFIAKEEEITEKPQEPEINEKVEEVKEIEEIDQKQEIKIPEKKQEEKKEKPLIAIKEKPKKKPKEKSDFAVEVTKFLDKKDIEVVEELEAKKREFFAMGRINTDIGKMEVLIIGKDKKKIT